MTTDTATEPQTKPRRPRAKKPVEIVKLAIEEAFESLPDSQTEPDPTPQPVLESPEIGQGATLDGQTDESTTISETSATGQPEALPIVVSGEGLQGIADTRWPNHYVEAMQEWQRRVERAEEECKEAESEMKSLKSQYSDAKKAFDGSVASLRTEVSRKPEKLPLFDNKPAAPAPAKATPDKEDDRWKGWKLEDVEDLPGGALDGFERVNLKTLGDLTSWQSRGNRLEDLPGIGPAKAEKISDTLASLHVSKPWEVATATPDEVEPDDEIVTPEEENEPEDAPGDDDDNWDDESDETDDE